MSLHTSLFVCFVSHCIHPVIPTFIWFEGNPNVKSQSNIYLIVKEIQVWNSPSINIATFHNHSYSDMLVAAVTYASWYNSA